MTRIMYDAVTLANVPHDATMVAAYVDGHYANTGEAERRFPRARIVRITVLGGTLAAHVIDCETGDATPAHAADWAKRKLDAGAHPTIYCNVSTWPSVRAEVHKLGLDGRVSYWLAHYDGVSSIPNGAVAKQYLGDYQGYDKSIVADYWPGVDPAPVLAPPFPYSRPLRKGMVRPEVSALKRRLASMGYRGTTPGPVFGSGLDRAVRAFQYAHHLVVDGVVGPVTAAAINHNR